MNVSLSSSALGQGSLATICLNRPQVRNALDSNMIRDLHDSFAQVSSMSDCRLMILRATGAHFCAGADINDMKASGAASESENLRQARMLAEMFAALANLRMPTLAICQGSVFGGGVGLAACCDVVLAEESTRFCLSEVKLGLIPAVIMPYLIQKMSSASLRLSMLTGGVFSSEKAASMGLVQHITSSKELGSAALQLINDFLACAPLAQRAAKRLHQQLLSGTESDPSSVIAAIRAGDEAQAGLSSFLAKKSPAWHTSLAELPWD